MTGLGDGHRVPKNSDRMRVIGEVDELNCFIGLVLTLFPQPPENPELAIGRDDLIYVQHKLFDVGGELSIPNHTIIDEDDVKHLETLIEEWNSTLSPLANFILPGGFPLVAQLHVARAVCRRAERGLVDLHFRDEYVNPYSLKFLNRLSDFLFVLARVHSRGAEVLWDPKRGKGEWKKEKCS